MKTSLKICLALSVPMAASLALAQQAGLPTVEVVGEAPETPGVTLQISCTNPTPPDLAVVVRLLNVPDTSRAPDLRNKLMAAAAEACVAGEGRITVARTSQGVIWKPVGAPVASDGDGN